jgi:hypothetical protein
MRRHLLTASLTLLLALWTRPAFADSVPIGEISFDVTTQAGLGSPGTNSFNLVDLTGPLSPTPGVATFITLSGQLTLMEGGVPTPQIIPFTNAGLLTNPTDLLDNIPGDVQILSATLTGTLDTTLVMLNGGSSPVTLSSSFTVTDPFNGNVPLIACDSSTGNPCSQGVLSASTSTVPEPGTLLLLGSGLGSFLLWRRRLGG